MPMPLGSPAKALRPNRRLAFLEVACILSEGPGQRRQASGAEADQEDDEDERQLLPAKSGHARAFSKRAPPRGGSARHFAYRLQHAQAGPVLGAASAAVSPPDSGGSSKARRRLTGNRWTCQYLSTQPQIPRGALVAMMTASTPRASRYQDPY